MKKEECKHNFVPAPVEKKQKFSPVYSGSQKNEVAILNIEHIYIFCTKCGKVKKLSLSNE